MKRMLMVSSILFISLLLEQDYSLFANRQPEAVSAQTKAVSANTAPATSAPNVTWTNPVNCAVTGNVLRKIKGRSDTPDAGAHSTQKIVSGDGYLEFTSNDNKDRYIGLSSDYSGTNYTTIDYAIHLTTVTAKQEMVAEVREKGEYKSEISYTNGTVFRITIEGKEVKYYRNGAHFYTSQVSPSYPLAAQASLIGVGATITGAMLGSAGSREANRAAFDPRPLALNNIKVMSAAAGGVAITWNTSKPASAQIDYGVSSAYGSSAKTNDLVASHKINLTDLKPSTTYHYKITARDAANNTTASANLTFTTRATTSDNVAGMLDDDQIHLPPNYLDFKLPPAAGGKYNDPVFGSVITRLTNGFEQFKDPVHHEYNTMSPFNKDNSKILVQADHQGFYVIDRAGQFVVHPSLLNLSNSCEPRWGNDPNVFYYHEGNKLKKYDLVAKQFSVVKTFAQYQSITFGGGECDISEDGDHLMIVGDMRHAGMYTFSTNTLGPTMDLTGCAEWDEVYVTGDNNVMIRWNVDGTGRCQGFEVFDKNMKFLRQVADFAGHNDQARDLNGDEVVVVAGYRDNKPAAGCENSGIEKIRLADGKKTCLLDLKWNTEVHVSANTSGKNPWVLVSVTDAGQGTAQGNTNLRPTWQKDWGVRFNEIILVKIDGSEVRRLAHHRTRLLSRYWCYPRATISRDGAYAIFDSNFGANPRPDYTDVFLIDLLTRPAAGK